MTKPIHIGFLIYPDVTQLDATGPAQVPSPSAQPGARRGDPHGLENTGPGTNRRRV